jgi:hypothetical protein
LPRRYGGKPCLCNGGKINPDVLFIKESKTPQMIVTARMEKTKEIFNDFNHAFHFGHHNCH